MLTPTQLFSAFRLSLMEIQLSPHFIPFLTERPYGHMCAVYVRIYTSGLSTESISHQSKNVMNCLCLICAAVSNTAEQLQLPCCPKIFIAWPSKVWLPCNRHKVQHMISRREVLRLTQAFHLHCTGAGFRIQRNNSHPPPPPPPVVTASIKCVVCPQTPLIIDFEKNAQRH